MSTEDRFYAYLTKHLTPGELSAVKLEFAKLQPSVRDAVQRQHLTNWASKEVVK